MRYRTVSLATKISTALVGLLLLAAVSSAVAITSAYRFEAFQETLIAENVASVRAAEELEIALLEQRGYVSSYVLDRGQGDWLDRLSHKSKDFDYWLGRARETARTDTERELLDRLEAVQHAYAEKRHRVVELYDQGREEEARGLLLGDVVKSYEQSYNLCEEFIAFNQQLVSDTSDQVRRQVEQVTVIVSITAVVTLGLGTALLWLFFTGVVFPLRRIANAARLFTGNEQNSGDFRSDEMRELGHFVKLLITNVTETRSDLEKSRSQLAQAEKLAAVGKLAASVAHEIRNPLTSMKMWLYSLRRAVGQNPDLQEKISIVSDETVRLESIVRQFLEFSRPPQLNVSRHPISELLDKTLELLKYRLGEHNVHVVRKDEPALPEVLADAEQLKQVLMNLITNAIEAMEDGGELRISVEQETRNGHPILAVRIADSGPGMSTELQERAFEPFFTTKSEGTGLGLCIAASIMARHGGALTLESSNTGGAECIVWIPTIEARRYE
ncbi:MAG TPA: ATP-binding protein [Pirellulaceae bacterium]|nr:ATP-binding protein [Pirellulaceae bacterium]